LELGFGKLVEVSGWTLNEEEEEGEGEGEGVEGLKNLGESNGPPPG
jgi:hypothetical protein